MDPRSSRAVILRRDESGYGLTISGDNPISVKTIKAGGPAEIVGICEGDIIIKVNGTLVEHMNHTEVVNLIRNAGPYVTLTVRTPEMMTGMPGVGLIGNSANRQHHVQLPHERTVTAPLPVDRGVQLQMQDNKFRTLQVYRDQAASEFEAAWKKYESTQSSKDKREFEKAEKSLRSIEAQMKKFRQSSPNLQLHSTAPFNPYPQSQQSVQFNQFHQYQQQQLTNDFLQGLHHHVQRVPPVPPPHPVRNRNPLSTQSSMPSFTGQGSWEHSGDAPPPLPPRSFSTATSLDSNTHPILPAYSPHDPSLHGQGSGQIINTSHISFQAANNNFNIGNSRSPKNNNILPSHNHHRTKSSPDPISMQRALENAEEGSRRSDSVNDLSDSIRLSRPSGSWDSFDSHHLHKATPPGSPPPPYGRHNENDSQVLDDEVLFIPIQGNINPAGILGGFSPGDIMAMEEDDCLISHDSPSISSMGKNGPWSSLTKLLTHNAHLAVFMNFVIGNKCDPSSLLFYLITSLQMEEATLKEMKRWGYEIHSTFTAPGSPLHVPHVDESIATVIDDNLVWESDKEEMMRRVFRKARNKAKDEINKQLEEFCTKKTAGLGTMFGPPDSQLEECLSDKPKEVKVIETYLVPRLDMFCEEYEKNSDDRTLAIINAVSTILQKQFFVRPSSSSSSNILERCGSFISKDKSLKARFISKHKKITHNGHHFTPQLIYSYTVCNICGKILWGVAPQGLQCSDCNIFVHRHCYVQIQDNCVGSEAEGPKKKDRLKQIKDKIRQKSDAPKRRSAINPLRRNLDENNLASQVSGFGEMDPEFSDLKMQNLKSRMKRRKQALTRGSHQNESSTSASTPVAVGADWEFVNFNFYGPKRTVSAESENVSLLRARPNQASSEDYYEFPTSTKLSPSNPPPNQAPLVVVRRRIDGTTASRGDSRMRHSLHSTYDLNLYHPTPLSPLPQSPPGYVGQEQIQIVKNRKSSDQIRPHSSILNTSVLDSYGKTAMNILDSPNEYLDPCPPLIPFSARQKHSVTSRPQSWANDSGAPDMIRQPLPPLPKKDSIHNVIQKAVGISAPSSSPIRHPNRGAPSPSRLPIPSLSKSPKLRTDGLLGLGKFGASSKTKGDKPLSSSGSSSGNLKAERRPDTLSEERLTQDGSTYEDGGQERPNQEPKRGSNIVGRSESCKERPQRKQPRERRKHSDPNLTSKSSDVDLDSHRILLDTNNSSASNSSLSARSSDSPSTSLELVAPHHSSSSLPGRSSETPDTTVGHSGDSYKPTQSWEGDSDIEVEQDPPDWTKDVPEDILSQLESREKKRQEVLNELFHTERSHVRNLKVVDRLFHGPIRAQQLLPIDLIQMLFGSWEDMLEIHEKFNTTLKRKRKENPVIGDIGPLLLEIFDGEAAEIFKRAAAACCARQQIGLKTLKERREKNPKLNAFLQEAEQDPVCRRLQLQDMIPMAMQRLTKYPLMFSKLCHYCAESGEMEEYKLIQRALEMSKEILNSVNHSKKEAEDHQRLVDMQGRLDKSSLEKGMDKSDNNFINELRNLNLTTHKLIHEGPLHWKVKSSKQKSELLHDVQLVLLDDMVVILLKQDERFVLKIHTSSSYPGKSERVILRPVIKLNNLIIRANAADKKAFMLINMTSSNMYDLVCSSTEERKQWLQNITKAAEDYKSKQESRRVDFHPSPNIPTVAVPPEERKETNDTIESGDGGNSEQEGGQELLLGTSPRIETSPTPLDKPVSAEASSPNPVLASGNGKLETEMADQNRNASSSPNAKRRVGEFLRVTETSPLIDPSEVLVTSRDIQFAQPVVSAHEELKRLDLSISKALGDKMSLVSQMLHIPVTSVTLPPFEEESVTTGSSAKDSKELIVACIQQVDKLKKIISAQLITPETLPVTQEQSVIATSLSSLLDKLMYEVTRKDEELDLRRQELHRLREQNHGYQERLQRKSSAAIDDSLCCPPIGSPVHSRLTNFVSLSSPSEHHDDEDEEMMKIPSKLQSSAISSCNDCSNPTIVPHLIDSVDCVSPPLVQSQMPDLPACELAREESADIVDTLESLDVLENQSGKHSESESEEFLLHASTLTLVPEKESEDDYVNLVPRRVSTDITKSNGHQGDDYENVRVNGNNCTKVESDPEKKKEREQKPIGDN